MITLIPVGEIQRAILEPLVNPLGSAFRQPVIIGARLPLHPEAFDGHRQQYLAFRLLNHFPLPPSGSRILGVTSVDIYSPGLHFVFGLADGVSGRAIVSVHRLRSEFYGLPADDRSLAESLLKEAVHELGHTYRLGHCPDRSCVMYFSNSLGDTDHKKQAFCPFCQRQFDAVRMSERE